MLSICLFITYIDLIIIVYLIKIHMTKHSIHYYMRCIYMHPLLYIVTNYTSHIFEYIYITSYIHSILF